jgi:rod shape-determining protein MreC
VSRLLERSWLFISLVALTLGGLAVSQSGRLEPLQRATADLFAPVESTLTAATSRVNIAIDNLRRLDQLQTENTELRAEVERLALENVRLTDAAAENIRLREALEFKQANPTLQMRGADVLARGTEGLVPGRVVSRDPSPYLSHLTINLGKRDGIREGMTVISPQGLVGRIIATGERTARVLLLTDRASAVNGLTMRTRATGIIQGMGTDRLTMRYIEQGVDIKVGDIVLTSGLGGAFPRSQPIGQVVSVRQQDIELFQAAEIRPTVDFSRLEQVIVVTQFEPIPAERP